MKLKVLTPESLVVDEEVESATLPAKDGQITVLSGHDLLITILKDGKLCYRKGAGGRSGREFCFSIGLGGAEVTHDSVTVFTKEAKRENQSGAVTVCHRGDTNVSYDEGRE